MCRQEEPVCRTISVCTGMQSSTLAGLLATQFLGISQAVPAACSVVVMAIFGLTLASYWGSGMRIRDLPLRFFPQASADARSWEAGFIALKFFQGLPAWETLLPFGDAVTGMMSCASSSNQACHSSYKRQNYKQQIVQDKQRLRITSPQKQPAWLHTTEG